MSRLFIRAAVFVAAFLVLAGVTFTYIATGNVITNSSPSMPEGNYLGLPFFAIGRGSVVVACLPPDAAVYARTKGFMGHGTCSGQEGVVKIVAAVAGDRVDVEHSFVSVNGVRLANSARASTDREGRVVPSVFTGERVVPPGSVWLMAPNAKSWDSRYYGLVPLDLVRARCVYLGTQPRLSYEPV